MSLLALFSLGWWKQKLAGPVIQALGAALAVLVVVAAAGLGLMWLREDARTDARAAAKVERAEAIGNALSAAAAQHDETLKRRDASIAAGEAEISALRKEMKERRDASPDPDTVVVPAGDPWLGGVRKRP